MKLLLPLLLLTLSGCKDTIIIPKVYLLEPCKEILVVPNNDGTLDEYEHLKLYNSRKCYKIHTNLYREQLINIRELNKDL